MSELRDMLIVFGVIFAAVAGFGLAFELCAFAGAAIDRYRQSPIECACCE